MSRPPRNGQGHLAAQAVQILVGGGGQTQLAAAVLAAQVHGVPVDLDAIAGAAAAAADAAPGGDVLQLRQHLIHNNVVGEGLRVLRLLLGGPDGQLLHLGGHLVLLAHIAADLPGLGAGQADAPAPQHCVGAALGLVRFAAQAAGHPQAEAGAVGLDEQLYQQTQMVRKTQIAREKEENYQFIQCLATPIYKNEKPFFAMSVSVPTFRYTEEKGQQIEKLLLEAKKSLELIL